MFQTPPTFHPFLPNLFRISLNPPPSRRDIPSSILILSIHSKQWTSTSAPSTTIPHAITLPQNYSSSIPCQGRRPCSRFRSNGSIAAGLPPKVQRDGHPTTNVVAIGV